MVEKALNREGMDLEGEPNFREAGQAAGWARQSHGSDVMDNGGAARCLAVEDVLFVFLSPGSERIRFPLSLLPDFTALSPFSLFSDCPSPILLSFASSPPFSHSAELGVGSDPPAIRSAGPWSGDMERPCSQRSGDGVLSKIWQYRAFKDSGDAHASVKRHGKDSE
jgi:hypothetical protein